MQGAGAAQRVLTACLCALSCSGGSTGPEPNPPLWPPSVVVLDPSDSATGWIEARLASRRESGADSYALLLRSGVYEADVPVAAFAQVLGLGRAPENVTFHVLHERGSVRRTALDASSGPRGLENLRVDGDLRWTATGVSALRRVDVAGDIRGAGFAANARIGGRVRTGGALSWVARACDIGVAAAAAAVVDATGIMAPTEGAGGSTALVALAGCVGVLPPGSVAAGAPVLVEKPWLEEVGGRFYLNVPAVEHGVRGVRRGPAPGRRAPFESVFLATPQHGAASIQRRLDAGLDVVGVSVIWDAGSIFHALTSRGSRNSRASVD